MWAVRKITSRVLSLIFSCTVTYYNICHIIKPRKACVKNVCSGLSANLPDRSLNQLYSVCILLHLLCSQKCIAYQNPRSVHNALDDAPLESTQLSTPFLRKQAGLSYTYSFFSLVFSFI